MLSDSAMLRRRGFSALRGNWQTALVITFFAGILGTIQSVIRINVGIPDNVYWMDSSMWDSMYRHASPYMLPVGLLALLQVFVSPSLSAGLNNYYITLVRGGETSFSMLFSRLHVFLKAFALYILIGIRIFLWTLLLIIPGIIAAYRYAMAPFLFAEDPEIGILEAIERSKKLMDGNKSRLFMLQLSFLGWNLLAAIAAGFLNNIIPLVGIVAGLFASLAVTVYLNASVTAFYVELTAGSNPANDRIDGSVV